MFNTGVRPAPSPSIPSVDSREFQLPPNYSVQRIYGVNLADYHLPG